MAAKSHESKSKRRKFTVPSLSTIRDEQEHGEVSKKVVLFGQKKKDQTTLHGETNKALDSSYVRSETGNSEEDGVQRNTLLSRKLSQRAGIVQPNQLASAVGGRGQGAIQGRSTEPPADVDPPSADTEGEAASLQVVGEVVPAGSRPKAGSSVAGAVVNRKPHAIVVNPVQRANSVMKYIVNVPWEMDDIVPDFIVGRTTCAFFLSVRYHTLHPNYIHERLERLGSSFELRLLLVHVDAKDCQNVLNELAKIALLANMTLILAWRSEATLSEGGLLPRHFSPEEAARYLETYKAYEHKPAEVLMERKDSDFSSLAIDCLTSVHKVNKTDAATLLNNFKTMDNIILATQEELAMCPGIGPQKAQRLSEVFHKSFQKETSTTHATAS